METSTEEYKDHLEKKYLPLRYVYLKYFFYGKILKQFSSEEIVDLGCGTGDFLKFLKEKNRKSNGIDNNRFLVDKCVSLGFNVTLDDVIEMRTISKPMHNAIVDNVLEHLDIVEIDNFFKTIKSKMSPEGTLVVIVPDKKGYTYDPTHKTFVDQNVISKMVAKYGLTLARSFTHPFNVRVIGTVLYLNMQVFTIKF